jgi:hemerythrin
MAGPARRADDAPIAHARRTAMATLTWNDALLLDMPEMDETHHEFVDLLNALEHTLVAGSADDVDAALARLSRHTAEHFALEEGWMAQAGLAPDNGHAFQHQAVLNVLREVRRLHAAEADRELVRRLANDLAHWFRAHSLAMDADLAQRLAERGIDSDFGAFDGPPRTGSRPKERPAAHA